jgi:hypothetical protein
MITQPASMILWSVMVMFIVQINPMNLSVSIVLDHLATPQLIVNKQYFLVRTGKKRQFFNFVFIKKIWNKSTLVVLGKIKNNYGSTLNYNLTSLITISGVFLP